MAPLISNPVALHSYGVAIGSTDLLATSNLPATPYQEKRATAVWGFAQIFAICQNAEFVLTEIQCVNLERARSAACTCYCALSKSAEEHIPARAVYPCKPKLHLMDHTLRTAISTRENPCRHWCFTDEDFVGRIKRLGGKCSIISIGLRCLRRWELKLWALLRLPTESK